MEKINGNDILCEFDLEEAKNSEGKEIEISACVHKVKKMGGFAFVILRTARYLIQSVYSPETCPDSIDGIKEGCFVTVKGTVRRDDRAYNGIEIAMTGIKLIHKPEFDYPLHVSARKIGCTLDVNLDNRSVALRNPVERAVFKFQEGVVSGFREFMIKNKFTEIHTPKIVAQGAEGGANLFRLEYFHRPAVLEQSPQFYKQMAMASGFDRIFEVGPVFRAEKSYTSKHTTEFTGFDLEFSYINSFRDVMKMEEELLTYALKAVKEAYGEDIQREFGPEVIVPTTPFPVVKLADLYKALEEEFGYTVDESEKGDLTTEAERLSYEWVKKHYGHEFLFITDYSAEKRAFYHMRDENGVPQGYDLIWRGVEITTGAQREHRYEVLKKQAEEKGLADDVKFYLEFFQYGCPPHGGFGLGIDRLTMLLCGLTIKDAEFLFRGPNRLTP